VEPPGGAPLWLPCLGAGGAGLAGRRRLGGADEARGGARVRCPRALELPVTCPPQVAHQRPGVMSSREAKAGAGEGKV